MLSLSETIVPIPKNDMMDVMGQSQALFSLQCDATESKRVAEARALRAG